MSRSKTKPYPQKHESDCGPASLKTAFAILGRRISYDTLNAACGVTKNGTPVKKLIKVANQFGAHVLTVEWATLRHIQSALKSAPQKPRVIIVDYLYSDQTPVEETGHYAVVSAYSARNGRIQLLDSYSETKKTYSWKEFLDQWYDYDYKRIKISKRGSKFRLSRKWHNRLMLVLSLDKKYLPKFSTPLTKFYPAK
jgi:ABC-type bacteriocin/lantibiotic exporter with double-glycine peptidase domain